MADDKKSNGITVYYLQKELCDEIERLTEDLKLKRPGCDDYVRLKAYRQMLPIADRDDTEILDAYGGEESQNKLFPFAVVQVDGGSIKEPSAEHRVNLSVIVGIFEDDKARDGHDDVMLIIERIIERFSKWPVLNKKFTLTVITDNNISNSHELFEWALSDPTDDAYPFYYGVLSLAFKMKGFEREDIYA